MNYKIIFYISTGIALFGAGWCLKPEKDLTYLVESNDFKRELIDLQEDVIELGGLIITQKELLDKTDPLVAEYCKAYKKMDDLIATQL